MKTSRILAAAFAASMAAAPASLSAKHLPPKPHLVKHLPEKPPVRITLDTTDLPMELPDLVPTDFPIAGQLTLRRQPGNVTKYDGRCFDSDVVGFADEFVGLITRESDPGAGILPFTATVGELTGKRIVHIYIENMPDMDEELIKLVRRNASQITDMLVSHADDRCITLSSAPLVQVGDGEFGPSP